jgi:thioesterase domain-containing protein
VPLICLPPAHGSAVTYLPLARLLDADQPVYALLFGDSIEGKTLEAIAADFIGLLRQTWPHGPFRLCGHSFGALLAYEMACQFSAAAEPVDGLLMLDGEVLSTRNPLPLLRRWPLHLKAMFRDRRLFTNRITWSLRSSSIRQPALSLAATRTSAEPSASQAIAARQTLFRNYTPRAYGGRIDLFRAELQPAWRAFIEPQPLNGWDSVCRDVHVRTVPGDHLTMIQEPHLAALATAMNECLSTADPSP